MSHTYLNKIPVAILGATGLVGQKAIALIDRHPHFYVSEVAASDSRERQIYGDAVCWRENETIPVSVAGLQLKNARDIESRYVISALPSDVAKEVEPHLASQGAYVFSNASAFRMDPSTPILIPEINIEHLSLLENQNSSGKIVTNSNCTTAFICLALKPLMSLGNIKNVSIVTMQAISGAGYPGIDSIDIMGNIIPHIDGEVEKINTETLKILGSANKPASFGIMTHVHRVPVLHGHTIVLHMHFDRDINLEDVSKVYTNENKSEKLYHLYKEVNRPQPSRDIGCYDQSVHIGKIKHGATQNILGLVVMGNNLVRGAAGASLRNLEATLNHLSIERCIV